MAHIKIECPKCKWEPKPNSLWSCSCGTSWHTFDTSGRCPSCKKQWDMTQCLSHFESGCGKWSPHLAWYKGLDPIIEEVIDEVNKEVEVEEGVLS